MTICGKVRKNGQVEDLLVEINKDLYKHKGKTLQSDQGRLRLQRNAMADLERLLADAEKAGFFLVVNSCYRTYEDQVRVWGTNCQNAAGSGRCVAVAGQSPAAIIGTSNHGWGLAVDLGDKDGKKIGPGRGRTPNEWKWIQENKHKYNFEQQNDGNESHHYNYTKPGVNCP